MSSEVFDQVSRMAAAEVGVFRVPVSSGGGRALGRWYLRINLPDHDVEELLVERGVEVNHVTVYRCVQRFTPLLADAARFTRRPPSDRRFADETYVNVNRVRRYIYRTVDQCGQVIDVLVSATPETADRSSPDTS